MMWPGLIHAGICSCTRWLQRERVENHVTAVMKSGSKLSESLLVDLGQPISSQSSYDRVSSYETLRLDMLVRCFGLFLSR